MTPKQKPIFDPMLFLAKVGKGRTISEYRKKQVIFSQGDPGDAIFYIHKGKVKLSDKQAPDSYKMAVEGSGGPGFIRGATIITLTDQDGGGTRVSYTADLQVGGLIASVGQRMLGGVSKMMADKFFNRMGELLED